MRPSSHFFKLLQLPKKIGGGCTLSLVDGCIAHAPQLRFDTISSYAGLCCLKDIRSILRASVVGRVDMRVLVARWADYLWTAWWAGVGVGSFRGNMKTAFPMRMGIFLNPLPELTGNVR